MSTGTVRPNPLTPQARTWCRTCRALYRVAVPCCPLDGAPLVAADDDPLIGTTIAGRYVIETLLGEGGLGRVYRARHSRMSKRFAVKVPFGELALDPACRQRFLREADVVSRFAHPGVVGAVDVGETDEGLLYMVMDLAEGWSLAEAMTAGPMPVPRAIELVRRIALGLAHAHGHGVVHRDLKPGNVIITERGACIVDFGIAALREGPDRRTRLTTEGTIIGTPEYMAPEQLSGAAVDARADLFALGVILYQLLAGALPFDGTSMEIATQNLACDVPRVIDRVGTTVDPLLEALAFWLMAKEAHDRPASAVQVAQVLGQIEHEPRDAEGTLAKWFDPRVLGVRQTLPDGRGMEALSLEPRRPARKPSVPLALGSVPPPFEEPVAPPRRRRLWPILAGLLMLGAGAIAFAILSAGDGEGRAPTPPSPSPAPAPAPAAAAEAAAEPETDSGTATEPEAGTATGTDRPRARPTRPAPSPGPVTHPDTSRTPAPTTTPARPTPTRPTPATTPTRTPTTTPTRPTTTPTPARPTPATTPARPPAPTVATAETFTSLYSRVGEDLDRYRKQHGATPIAPLTQRYRSIAYLDAVRTPSLRAAAIRELESIRRDLARLPD